MCRPRRAGGRSTSASWGRTASSSSRARRSTRPGGFRGANSESRIAEESSPSFSPRGSARGPPSASIRESLLDLPEPDAPEFEAGAVVLEAEVALARAGLQVLVVGHAGVDHLFTVERDGHLVALAADADRVPLARRLLRGLRRGDHPVDRRRVLERLDLLVD